MTTIATVSILGSVTKKANARTGFDIPMDVVVEVESDRGAQVPLIAAEGTWTTSIEVGSEVDLVVVSTPRPLTLSLTADGGTVTDLVIRGVFVLQTRAISEISLYNGNSVPVSATVALVREEAADAS